MISAEMPEPEHQPSLAAVMLAHGGMAGCHKQHLTAACALCGHKQTKCESTALSALLGVRPKMSP